MSATILICVHLDSIQLKLSFIDMEADEGHTINDECG